MKLSQLMAGAVLSLSLTLTGCAATSMLSAVTDAVSPSKPDITAQVGAENTKQGIGVTAKTSSDTKVGDVSGSAKVDTAKQGKGSTTVKDVTGSVDASKQGQAITAGPVQAEVVNVTQGDTRSLLWSFGLGLAAILLAVFGLVLLFLKLRKVKTNGQTESNQS